MTPPAPPTIAPAAAADFAVIAAEYHDVAHQREIRAANLADARARALLHAIAGVEILLLHDVCDLAALDHGELAILRDARGQHGLDALPMFSCVPKIAWTAVMTVE